MWIDCSFHALEIVGGGGRGKGLTFEPLMHVKVFQFLFCMTVTIFSRSLFNNARAPRKGREVTSNIFPFEQKFYAILKYLH